MSSTATVTPITICTNEAGQMCVVKGNKRKISMENKDCVKRKLNFEDESCAE